jgi:ER membrane protein complex subunit 6-like protein
LSKKKPAKKGFWDKAKESAAQQQAVAKRDKAEKKKPLDKASESKPSAPVEKTPEEKKRNYKDGIIKTIVPALIGTAAGFFCFFQLGSGTEFPWLSVMLFVIIFSYYAQRLVYPLIGIDLKEFGKKDWFYVEFITIDFWLVVWTLLLNPL